MAQATSAKWKELLAMHGTRREYKFDVAGVEYGVDEEVTHTAESVLYSENGIGNCACASMRMSFFSEQEPPRAARITRYVRLNHDGETSEWLPKGTFFINLRSVEDGFWELETYDPMRKADTTWWNNDYRYTNWPMPVADAVADIAARMGVEIDSRTVLDPAYLVPFPVGAGTIEEEQEQENSSFWTMRETLSYIAAANAGNWVITDEGKLRLLPLIPTGDPHELDLDITASQDMRDTLPVSRVTFGLGDDTVVTAGDDTGREVTAVCPFATDEMAAAVLAKLRGYVYRPFQATSSGLDPAAELGDLVTVDGISSVIASIRDDGYGYPDIAAPGEGIIDEEYPGASPMQRQIDRKIAGTRSLISKTNEEIRLEVDAVDGRVSELVVGVGEIETRVHDAEGRQTQIEQTIDSIRFSVSDPIAGPSGAYVTMELTVGGNTYHGVVMIDGNVDVTGSISASELYAMYGSVAHLEVDRLSTSRRIVKYLAGDTSDDQFVKIEGQYVRFIQGTNTGGTEQAMDPNGGLLYWEQDISEAVLGSDGYPRVDGQRVYTTNGETAWPVMVYTYSEMVKMSMQFDESGLNEPSLTFGAGWGGADPDDGKGFIRKNGASFDMWLQGSGAGDVPNGVYVGVEYTDIVGLRGCKNLDFSSWDSGYFAETLDGDIDVSYDVEFDGQGRPVQISDDSGHLMTITW